MSNLFTSESVAEGHPDKVCDQISDAVLDAVLTSDPYGRVACEVAAGRGLALIFGEITTSAYVDLQTLVRDVVRRIGYTDEASGFGADSIAILTNITEQSPDIAAGVDDALETRGASGSSRHDRGPHDQGAGDQGMMFGFACDETAELMPAPISLAHRIVRRLAAVRHDGTLPYLGPDGKTQVSVRYADGPDGRPVAVETVVLSAQHSESTDLDRLRADLTEMVIRPSLPSELTQHDPRILINPTDRFVRGGPAADAGLTGRKIIVDTYGGMARHGGGAFSGKDPSKVDRSGAYAARWVAKNIVAAGLARRCEVQVCYAIGVAQPVALRVEAFGTGTVSDERLEQLVRDVFDLRPAAIIDSLGLRAPIYAQTAVYGHFGRPDLDLPWERTNCVAELRDLASAA